MSHYPKDRMASTGSPYAAGQHVEHARCPTCRSFLQFTTDGNGFVSSACPTCRANSTRRTFLAVTPLPKRSA